MTTISPGFTPSMFPAPGAIQSAADVPPPAISPASGVAPPPAQTESSSTGAYDPLSGPSSTPTDPGMSLDRMQALLAQLRAGAVDLNALAELIIKQSFQQQVDALNDRLAVREAAKSELLSQASDELKAAAKMESSALTGLIVSVVTATASFVLAGASTMKSLNAGRGLMALETGGGAKGDGAAGGVSAQGNRSRVDPDITSQNAAGANAPVDGGDDSGSVQNDASGPEGEPRVDRSRVVPGGVRADTSGDSSSDAETSASGGGSDQPHVPDEGNSQGLNQIAAERQADQKLARVPDHSSADDGPEATASSTHDRAVAIKNVDLANQSAQNYSNTANSIDQVGNAAAGYINTTGQADAKAESAKGDAAAAKAQDDQAQLDLAKEIQTALEDMIKAVIGFLQQVHESKAEEMQSITRG